MGSVWQRIRRRAERMERLAELGSRPRWTNESEITVIWRVVDDVTDPKISKYFEADVS